jgi:hypothetical protein
MTLSIKHDLPLCYKCFVCNISMSCYIYYMKSTVAFSCPSLNSGDLVLYTRRGQMAPAVLVEAAGGDCWLARDARHSRNLLYLAAENVVMRLARVDADLLAEAA